MVKRKLGLKSMLCRLFFVGVGVGCSTRLS